MKIAVFGASGGCGRHVLAQAVARGWDVTAIVRAPLEVPGVRVVECDLDAIAGADAVISCLGIRRRHPRNPWSRMMSPPDFTSTSAAKIVTAMRKHGVDKLVAISAAGVGDSAARLSWPLRLLFGSSQIGVAYRDLAAMEEVYATSGARCLIARPVTLTNGAVRPAREVARFGLFSTISRASVAAWMLDHIGDTGRVQLAT